MITDDCLSLTINAPAVVPTINDMADKSAIAVGPNKLAANIDNIEINL
jgi:hypothetical protein